MLIKARLYKSSVFKNDIVFEPVAVATPVPQWTALVCLSIMTIITIIKKSFRSFIAPSCSLLLTLFSADQDPKVFHHCLARNSYYFRSKLIQSWKNFIILSTAFYLLNPSYHFWQKNRFQIVCGVKQGESRLINSELDDWTKIKFRYLHTWIHFIKYHSQKSQFGD